MHYFALHDACVAIDGISDLEMGRLLFDLDPFFKSSAAPTGTCVCRIDFSSNRDDFEAASALARGKRWRRLVMHYPSDVRSHRFGKLVCHGDLEYVFDTPKGSFYVLDHQRKSIRLFNKDRLAGAKEIRRLVRDQILMFWFESTGAVVVHSSLVQTPHGGVLFVGGRGSGKTTFFTGAVFSAHPVNGITSERTLVVPQGGTVLLYGLPEKINYLPGTLASFKPTEALAEGIDPSLHWERAGKFLIHWSKILGASGKSPGTNGLPLQRVVFPQYGHQHLSDISPEEALLALRGETLTLGDPVPHTNWLDWFRPDMSSAEQTLSALCKAPAQRLGWESLVDVETYFADVSTRP